MNNTAKTPSGKLLDNSKGKNTHLLEGYDGQDITVECFQLKEILSIMGLKPIMGSFQVVAEDLSRIARKNPPWTAKYIHSAYFQYPACRPSPRLSRAINALWQRVKGEFPGIAGSVYSRILAAPYQVPDGTFVPVTARVIKCHNPGCSVRFIQTNPAQLYHDPICKIQWKKIRRRKGVL